MLIKIIGAVFLQTVQLSSYFLPICRFKIFSAVYVLPVKFFAQNLKGAFDVVSVFILILKKKKIVSGLFRKGLLI